MAEAVAPQVFTRRASGLVRVMSPYSAFIYNILTMGLIFPWTYLWAPTAFQGSNLVLGILFAFLFELPIALAYVWLATSLPRSGGDYVFQSRVFGGGFGFTVVFAFFVVWILQWVALSGWLLASSGSRRPSWASASRLEQPGVDDIGTWAAGTTGIIVISIAERVCRAGAARDGVPQLRPVPVRDVVRDPRSRSAIDADAVPHERAPVELPVEARWVRRGRRRRRRGSSRRAKPRPRMPA